MRIKDVCIAAVICALVACGGDSTAPAAARPSPKVLSVGSGLTSDTVLGVVPDLLRVEVRDSSGQLAPGIPVQFHITAPAGTLDPFQRGIFACDPRYATCVTFGSNTRTGQIQLDGFSDASGIASARIQHGTVAMSGQIDISAPSLNIATSVAYTTLPGALVRIALNHADTSVGSG